MNYINLKTFWYEHLKVNVAWLPLLDERNTFYARFETHNTTHTESAPTAAAEEVSTFSISVADVTDPSNGWTSVKLWVRPCAQSMRFPASRGFTDIFNLSLSLSVVPACFKKSTIVPYLRKIKSHAWMTGGPLLWPPSSASVLRSLSETTSALCCLLHWTHYNLHTAVTVPQTMLLPSPCTLLSPTWKIRTPMWGCCSWIIVRHLTP